MRHYTSIEQSKRLRELGLSSESADMCYLPTHLGDEHHWIPSLSSYSECTKMIDVSIDYCIPCWSVGALMEVMTEFKDLDNQMKYPSISKNSYGYFGYVGIRTQEYHLCKTPIDTAYNIVVWLLTNKTK